MTKKSYPSRRSWSDEEREVLRQAYPDTATQALAQQLGRTGSQVYSQANVLGIKKSAEYMASEAACRLRRGDNVGKKYRFQRGITPWNKGKKGLQIGGKETRFKPQNRPRNAVPVGTAVMSTDGYLKIKVAEPDTWRYVHRMTWEDLHGPIPEGMCLVFRDGNHNNCAIENLELITRKQLMQRNSIHCYPEEIRSVVQIRAGIVRRINDKLRRKA
jgi:hypothetical protein